MLRSQAALVKWTKAHFFKGRALWVGDLGPGPDYYLRHADHGALATFYAHYGKYENWAIELAVELASRLVQPAPFINAAERYFNVERPLRFVVVLNGAGSRTLNLAERALFEHGGAAVAEARQLIAVGTVAPSWNHVRESMATAMHRFEHWIIEQAPTLRVLGEPQAPDMAAAFLALQSRTYVDAATARTHLIDAERLFLQSDWKAAAGLARNTVEQLIHDAHHEFRRRRGQAPANTPTRNMTIEMATGQFLARASAAYAYGTFSLLSEIGAHPGAVSDAQGERAWQAFRAAITDLAEALPA